MAVYRGQRDGEAARRKQPSANAGGGVNPSSTRQSVAAFFDVDGTLLGGPSLERRMFRALLYRRMIPAGNFALWMAEAMRLGLRGIAAARQGNKMYLRGVSPEAASAVAERVAGTGHISFFPEAVERVAWHAAQGTRIVLISGTLQILAECAARSLEAALLERGVGTAIYVCATQPEEIRGRWTGRVAGEPMFGRAKATSIQGLAARMGWDLGSCFAYGDSVHDQAMLACVGHAMAVNASPAMRRAAVREGWGVVEWREAAAGIGESRGGGTGTPLAERNMETLG
jgi:HAD superfamily hydrolase (TIGR01490 family)